VFFEMNFFSSARRKKSFSLILLAVLITSLLFSATVSTTRADAGYALAFDGVNDLVRLGYAAQMMAPTWTTTKTIELWVKPEGASPVCAYNAALTCDYIFGDKPEWWGISRGIINGQDRIWVFNFDGSMDQIGASYTIGEWVHISLVHGGGLLKIFRNGVEIASRPSGATMQPNTGAFPTLFIGGIIFHAARNYTMLGQIDEVRIWNTVRTPAELQANMAQEIPGSEPGLAAYYRMTDGSGTFLTDDSGHGWTGTLYDGGWGVPPNGSLPQWVISDAFGSSGPTSTPTQTLLPSFTPTVTATFTPAPPTNTPTATQVPPTATVTFTVAPPTNTPTATLVPPTATPTHTPTFTPVVPTNTPTWTPIPPTVTHTPEPTMTFTPGPTATVTNTPPPQVGAGFALAFDGVNDTVRLAQTALMMPASWTATKSVELWVRPDGSAVTCASPDSCDYFFGDKPTGWGISRGVIGTQDRIWAYNYDGTVDRVGVEYVPGEWVHIALVHDGGVLRIFKNGIEAGSVVSGATRGPVPSQSVLYIGGVIYNASRNYTMLGQIDEVRLWSVARSAADLQANMMVELSGAEAGLSAYYKMSDGSGTTLTDDSGHGWNGTLLDGGPGVPADGLPAQWVASEAF
jgi:hypothetical protein